MKKIIFLIFFSIIFYQEAVFSKTMWEESFIYSKNAEIKQYFLSLNGSECKINVSKEDLIIIVYDFDWPIGNQVFAQYIFIGLDGKIQNLTWQLAENKDGSKYFIDGGYNIFYQKFRQYAQDLPYEVRSRFRGYCGID